MKLVDVINSEYMFLIKEHEYKIKSLKKCSFKLISDTSNIIFFIFREKGIDFIQITSSSLFNGFVNVQQKAINFFYLVKLLYPDIDYKDIRSLQNPKIIEEKWDEIIILFADKNIKKTVNEIENIRKEYNKIRWAK